MALCISPPKITVGMDFQLFDIVCNGNGQKTIIALNPIARDALITYHGEGFISSLILVAELVLGGKDFTNDTKGRIVEKYITTVLEVSKRYSFPSKNTTKNGLLTVRPILKNAEFNDVVHFSGNKLPLPNSFNRKASTLFLPKSPNYPGLDFFIWNPVEEILMGFQVTVKQPFTSHPKIDGASDNCKLWLDFCYGNSDKKPMEVYWIVPKSCVGKLKNFEDRVVLLDDLYHIYLL